MDFWNRFSFVYSIERIFRHLYLLILQIGRRRQQFSRIFFFFVINKLLEKQRLASLSFSFKSPTRFHSKRPQTHFILYFFLLFRRTYIQQLRILCDNFHATKLKAITKWSRVDETHGRLSWCGTNHCIELLIERYIPECNTLWTVAQMRIKKKKINKNKTKR